MPDKHAKSRNLPDPDIFAFDTACSALYAKQRCHLCLEQDMRLVMLKLLYCRASKISVARLFLPQVVHDFIS